MYSSNFDRSDLLHNVMYLLLLLLLLCIIVYTPSTVDVVDYYVQG